jgi:hypothetical protein|tara:strand:+ start:463 stop:1218 length:756 start_codon:yes stop_codon:yes gene_type:complete
MTTGEEFTQEASVKTEATEESQAKDESQAQEIESQQKEKSYTQAELDEALTKERKVVSKHANRIRDLENRSNDFAKVLSSLAGLEDFMAQFLDSQGFSVEEAAVSNVERLKRQRQATTATPASSERQTEANALEELAKKAGLVRGTEEMQEAIEKFQYEGYYSASEHLKEIIAIKAKAEKAKQDKANEELKASYRLEVLKEYGINSVEAEARPGGGMKTFSRKQIGDMSPDEYAENEPAIARAAAAGKIRD